MALRNRELVWQVVDGEAMIVDVTTGEFYSLNVTATNIWTALHNGQTLAEIVDFTSARYGVARVMVQQDTDDLVSELKTIGLWTND